VYRRSHVTCRCDDYFGGHAFSTFDPKRRASKRWRELYELVVCDVGDSLDGRNNCTGPARRSGVGCTHVSLADVGCAERAAAVERRPDDPFLY
jgi:hypothetical protein